MKNNEIRIEHNKFTELGAYFIKTPNSDLFIDNISLLLKNNFSIEIIQVKENLDLNKFKNSLAQDKDIFDVILFENCRTIEDIINKYIEIKQNA